MSDLPLSGPSRVMGVLVLGVLVLGVLGIVVIAAIRSAGMKISLKRETAEVQRRPLS